MHRIQVASTTQNQFAQRPVLANAPTTPVTRIDWDYMPDVITVNVAGDSGSGTCPVDAISSPPTCDIRTALTAANNVSGTQPVLIQFTASPGTLTGVNLQIQRRRLTLDGTDANGNPWIVGDANAAAAGSVDPIARVLEFSVNRGVRIDADDVTLKGLEIRQSQDPNTVSNAKLVYQLANRTGTRLEAVRLNGDNMISCGNPSVDCSSFIFSLVRVEAQTSAPTARSMTLQNVDARAGAFAGLEMLRNTDVLVQKSWLRNSYQSNLRADAATLTLVRSTLEGAGRRASDGVSMVAGAPGLRLTISVPDLSGATYTGTENIIRNNNAAGFAASGNAHVRAGGDSYCGNGGSGFTSAVGPSSFRPAVTGQGRRGTTYNTLHGARVAQDDFSQVAFNDDSVFARNGQCGLFNESTDFAVSAVNNQWDDPLYDTCVGASGVGLVTYTPEQNEDTVPIAISGTFPSNVILVGQTVQIAGTGFNAIRGNPAATAPVCANGPGGATVSCCRKSERANRCAGVNTPMDGDGNCVEFRTGTGNWYAAKVRAVTPGMLESEVPWNAFTCLGNSGEKVRVSKTFAGFMQVDDQAYCDNTAAL